MPPRPSGTMSARAHLPEDAPPRRVRVQAEAPVVHFAAKAVVPLAPFFTEPPIQTVPSGTATTEVKFAPAGSTGCTAACCQPDVAVQWSTSGRVEPRTRPKLSGPGLPTTAQMLLAETALTAVIPPLPGNVCPVHRRPLKWKAYGTATDVVTPRLTLAP